MCLRAKKEAVRLVQQKSWRAEEKGATMREGGKFSIMAVCTSVKLEAYGDRRVASVVLL